MYGSHRRFGSRQVATTHRVKRRLRQLNVDAESTSQTSSYYGLYGVFTKQFALPVYHAGPPAHSKSSLDGNSGCPAASTAFVPTGGFASSQRPGVETRRGQGGCCSRTAGRISAAVFAARRQRSGRGSVRRACHKRVRRGVGHQCRLSVVVCSIDDAKANSLPR